MQVLHSGVSINSQHCLFVDRYNTLGVGVSVKWMIYLTIFGCESAWSDPNVTILGNSVCGMIFIYAQSYYMRIILESASDDVSYT